MAEEREIDVRGLESPEPFERIVDGLTKLASGERLRVLIHREPLPLFAMLRENGYQYTFERHDDGNHVLRIWEPGA